MKKILYSCFAILLSISCTSNNVSWTEEEMALIQQDSALMRVLQVTDKADNAFLRKNATDIPQELIGGEVWQRLASRMLATVQDENHPGVGIAGPQVGIGRRIVTVQRFDKEGEPFETYPNIRITAARGERQIGPEGCLSVPDRRGEVLRWQDIDIKYTSTRTLKDTCETVRGFTAVIFQHECDHLDGIIYTDRLDAQEGPERIAEDIRICVDHENGVYATGETVTVTAGMIGVYGKGLEMTVLEYGKRKETIALGNIGYRDTVYTRTLTEPVAVMLEFRAQGQTPEELPKDVNLDEDSFRIGFIAGVETFGPGNPEPSDVKEFWKGQVARMREMPVVSKMVPVSLTAKDSIEVECYDVEINAPDGVPVRGYLALPRNAAAGSCPIVLRFHGAGIAGKWARSKIGDVVKYAKKGAICFDINALGMLNGQSEEYYRDLEKGPLKGYSGRPLEDRETYFFKNMILRAERGLDFAAQLPEWDGKRVIAMGESQGGFQSAMLAGIDPRVTHVFANVPAGVGTGGSRAGRCDSWPNVLKNSEYSQYAYDNAAYFDGAILLKGCKANCVVLVGLVDTTCPAAEIFSGFNQVEGNVTYLVCPYRHHLLNRMPGQYRPWWDENVGRVRTEAIDAAIRGE